MRQDCRVKKLPGFLPRIVTWRGSRQNRGCGVTAIVKLLRQIPRLSAQSNVANRHGPGPSPAYATTSAPRSGRRAPSDSLPHPLRQCPRIHTIDALCETMGVGGRRIYHHFAIHLDRFHLSALIIFINASLRGCGFRACALGLAPTVFGGPVPRPVVHAIDLGSMQVASRRVTSMRVTMLTSTQVCDGNYNTGQPGPDRRYLLPR